MLTIALGGIPKAIEEKLLADARSGGVPIAEYLRDFIIEHFDEAEDRQIAESRLADRRLPISGRQMRRELGLEG